MTNHITELDISGKKRPEDMTDEEKLAYMRKIMNDEEYEQLLIDYHKRLALDKLYRDARAKTEKLIMDLNLDEN